MSALTAAPPTPTARERKTQLTARLKLLEAQSNDAIARGKFDAADAFDNEWHAILIEWMAAADQVEAERGIGRTGG